MIVFYRCLSFRLFWLLLWVNGSAKIKMGLKLITSNWKLHRNQWIFVIRLVAFDKYVIQTFTQSTWAPLHHNSFMSLNDKKIVNNYSNFSFCFQIFWNRVAFFEFSWTHQTFESILNAHVTFTDKERGTFIIRFIADLRICWYSAEVNTGINGEEKSCT